jgi:histidinol-phosphate aminotransferase
MSRPFALDSLLRPNVLRLKPYSSARDEFEGEAEIYLDANENPFPAAWNRYPDPHQKALKAKVAALKGVSPAQVFLGNGSDEAIDLLYRAFCRPGEDVAVILPPTYGMYSVSAAINDIGLLEIPLDADFQPDLDALLPLLGEPRQKLLFICSPNNPTANLVAPDRLQAILATFPGVVIVDEAYIDFAPGASCLALLDVHPNLVVLQTFSKAWGMAGVRLGMAFASPAIIAVLGKIKPPYNLSGPAQAIVSAALDQPGAVTEQLGTLLAARQQLAEWLQAQPQVLQVFPSDANFLLVRFEAAGALFAALRDQGIIVRDRRGNVPDALRLTIGTPAENLALTQAIHQFYATQA